MCSGSEAGSYVRLIDFCVSLNSRLESNEEEAERVSGGLFQDLGPTKFSIQACNNVWRGLNARRGSRTTERGLIT